MPRFMTLFDIAPAAWAALAPRPKDRGAALGARLRELGADVLDLHQVFGGVYDAAALYTAPDAAAQAAAVAALRALGPGRTSRTIALPASEHPADALRRLLAAAAADARDGADHAVAAAADPLLHEHAPVAPLAAA